eukprot:CAMPEP_0195027390 /NCGR_PEP_ID=MMETSP0326_2-20130528/52196_1 /TAXON_ID=2866 ORGANISM="Crypthecodinium cohnii, Strain Seligo" /NCGR_SAMPLE_ID=MMETSP0326_2 /ASSEMBLY_ACC=CAM_ASM_000348 /LENGTH=51 /DNA_ID=CAMNT_0040049549 /DNA_START=13 /DNA_END=168 /DNA_ORIENTATION=-
MKPTILELWLNSHSEGRACSIVVWVPFFSSTFCSSSMLETSQGPDRRGVKR